jgi:uncharacterized protein YndB with AHSA1/START domain
MFELEMTQEFNAAPEQVFNAWTKADVMKNWFAPGDMSVPEATADARPGGAYRIVMQEPSGDQHIVGGEFKELNPHSLIAFTWQWEGSPNTTLVTIKLSETAEGKTQLSLVHSEFIEEGFRDHHQDGWNGCLANLHKHFS